MNKEPILVIFMFSASLGASYSLLAIVLTCFIIVANRVLKFLSRDILLRPEPVLPNVLLCSINYYIIFSHYVAQIFRVFWFFYTILLKISSSSLFISDNTSLLVRMFVQEIFTKFDDITINSKAFSFLDIASVRYLRYLKKSSFLND